MEWIPTSVHLTPLWNWICLPATPRRQNEGDINGAESRRRTAGSGQINRDITWPRVQIATRLRAGAAKKKSAALPVVCGEDVCGDGGGSDAKALQAVATVFHYSACQMQHCVLELNAIVSRMQRRQKCSRSRLKVKSNHPYVKQNNNMVKVEVLIQLLFWSQSKSVLGFLSLLKQNQVIIFAKSKVVTEEFGLIWPEVVHEHLEHSSIIG